MAEREFRLPGSSYEELVNIIVAYGTRDEAARPGDVGKLDAVHQSSVSRNNGFLTEIGVLQGESKKLITRRGRALALALARRDRAEIRRNWRAVVATNEFLQNVVVLKAAGLLREEAGELVATFDEDIELDEFVEENGSPPEVEEFSEPTVSATVEASEGSTVTIHLHVRCTADEIEDLAPRLKALLRELSDPSPRG